MEFVEQRIFHINIFLHSNLAIYWNTYYQIGRAKMARFYSKSVLAKPIHSWEKKRDEHFKLKYAHGLFQLRKAKAFIAHYNFIFAQIFFVGIWVLFFVSGPLCLLFICDKACTAITTTTKLCQNSQKLHFQNGRK